MQQLFKFQHEEEMQRRQKEEEEKLNKEIEALAKELAEKAINFNTKEEFLASPYNDTMTVADKCIEQTGVIGEKIEIGSFEVLEGAFIGSYVHGNKIAAITSS